MSPLNVKVKISPSELHWDTDAIFSRKIRLQQSTFQRFAAKYYHLLLWKMVLARSLWNTSRTMTCFQIFSRRIEQCTRWKQLFSRRPERNGWYTTGAGLGWPGDADTTWFVCRIRQRRPRHATKAAAKVLRSSGRFVKQEQWERSPPLPLLSPPLFSSPLPLEVGPKSS